MPKKSKLTPEELAVRRKETLRKATQKRKSKERKITITIDLELADHIETAIAILGISKSQLIVQSIKKHLHDLNI